MTDIFHSWKEQRFVIAPTYLLANKQEIVVVLSDIKFWSKNIDALTEWCQNNDAETQGMTVVFKDKKSLTAFLLKWS